MALEITYRPPTALKPFAKNARLHSPGQIAQIMESAAFLSPDLTKAILNGEQPPGLRLAHLLDMDIPLSWTKQGEMFGRVATAA